MKRFCAAVLALLLLTATLASCTVKTKGGAKTPGAGATTTVATSATESTGGGSDAPADTTATETESAPENPGDEYSKNY